MIEIVSERNIKNGEIITKENLEKMLEKDDVKIYEVIRVINRRPVFLKEHYDRMAESIRLSGLKGRIGFCEFSESVNLLIKENSFSECNIRVSYFEENEEPVVLMYYVKSFYPERKLFEEGIFTVAVKLIRKNPNVKQYQANFKDAAEKAIRENNAFEAILINEDDTVSEGSKSNVFFVKDGKLVTSKNSQVLLGVTRSKVIETCEKNGIEVVKRTITYEELKDFDGAFITGTSNDVLPIKAIGSILYDSSKNEVVKKASELYLNEMKKEYEG
jgi:branched-chain amino acid aminotransferase